MTEFPNRMFSGLVCTLAAGGLFFLSFSLMTHLAGEESPARADGPGASCAEAATTSRVEEKARTLSLKVDALEVPSLRAFLMKNEVSRYALSLIQQCMLAEREWQKLPAAHRTSEAEAAHQLMLETWKGAIAELRSSIGYWYETGRAEHDAYEELLTSSPDAYRLMDEQHRVQSLVLLVTKVLATDAREDSAACRFIDTVYGESPDSYGKTLEALPALFIKAHTCADSEASTRNLCHINIVNLLNDLPWQESGYAEWLDILACLFNAIHR